MIIVFIELKRIIVLLEIIGIYVLACARPAGAGRAGWRAGRGEAGRLVRGWRAGARPAGAGRAGWRDGGGPRR